MRNLITIFTFFFVFAKSIFSQEDLKSLQREIQRLKKSYNSRISSLEKKVSKKSTSKESSQTQNPSINVYLNGLYSSFSSKRSNISGFAYEENAPRGDQGITVDESQMNLSSEIDDRFFGNLTFGLFNSDGDHSSTVLVEEAYIQTLPNDYKPNQFVLKVGKAFWDIGYLNTHNNDFTDAPLPYRFFLNETYNDSGAELSYFVPFFEHLHVGMGLFQGNDFPFGGNTNRKGIGAWSGFVHLEKDISKTQSFRIGGTILSGISKPKDELEKNLITFTINQNLDYETEYKMPTLKNAYGVISKNAAGQIENKWQPASSLWLPTASYLLYGEQIGGRQSNDHKLYFVGDTQIGIATFNYTISPNGEGKKGEIRFNNEYFVKKENGIYEDTSAKTGLISFKSTSTAYYNQVVYQILDKWQVGARYSRLIPHKIDQGYRVMSLFTNSSKNSNESFAIKNYKTKNSDLVWVENKKYKVQLQDGEFTKPTLIVPGSLVGTVLDGNNFEPQSYSFTLNYKNSEFSTIFFQYNREEFSSGQIDNQFTAQYTMSFGIL